MKVLIAFFCCSLFTFGQDHDKVLYGDYVECYYSMTTTNPILVYEAINGKVVDSLFNIEDQNTWYKLTILESEYGWFKIRNIKRLPSSEQEYDYENYWVRNLNFLVNVDSFKDTQYVYLYDLPSTKANKIHKLDEYQKVNVTEVDGHWSKVKFKVGKKEIEGWLGLKYQMANPLATASKYD